MKEKKLFKKANASFANKQYDKALLFFGQLLAAFPDNKEYALLTIICDIALENEEKAIFFYDYYFVVKNDSTQESAIKVIEDFIATYDENNEKMVEVLQFVSMQEIEKLNVVWYQEFLQLVRSRGSFKKAFEDVMFSTKVAITTKEEFFDFISLLIENGFFTIASNYLENYNELFRFDERFQELYKQLEGKRFDNI